MDYTKIINDFLSFYFSLWESIWVLINLLIILFLSFTSFFFPNSKIFIFFEMIFEWVYNFFEDILWTDEKNSIKIFITSMFFIILISNFFWVITDFMLPAFVWNNLEISNYVVTPTATMNFTVAISIIAVLYILIQQILHLWIFKFIHEYIPLLWKWYIPYEKWNLPFFIDLPLFFIIKIFDIAISLFLWVLDIIWIFAKIISLSFRLFWNVTSWWVLLLMMVWWLNALTNKLIATNFDFPIIFPLVIYSQGILVALIQAFVFSLLTAIFIKASKA